ncbi:lysine transporter LysE [Salinarimonas soli]|uniref:Lysine transporter LysE n=1 Tax=Salinarimonas soli TaxID=1638099 RepID=A0A5B2V7Q4_9HYPH|nr:lysine transporter LysE [Salinarimonas soli]KAA2235001.1 lysine transporter LysE [Salinarimonas soli]
MDAPLALIFAVLALLATPGPTNTLLAASGALVGARRSLVLVPAEIAGYLTGIGALLLVVGPALAGLPPLGAALKLAAGAYLARSSFVLWRGGGAGPASARVAVASPQRVLVTTLLNPKALVFAFGIFPTVDPLTAAPLFAGLVALAALGWILVGAWLGRAAGAPGAAAGLARAAALAQGGFAAAVAGSAVAAF